MVEKVQLNCRIPEELRDWLDRELALWNRHSRPTDRRTWQTSDVVVHALQRLQAVPKVQDRMPPEHKAR